MITINKDRAKLSYSVPNLSKKIISHEEVIDIFQMILTEGTIVINVHTYLPKVTSSTNYFPKKFSCKQFNLGINFSFQM